MSAARLAISALFDGEVHEFEGHISEEFREHGATVRGFSFAEGETLDPYETASAEADIIPAANADIKQKMIHMEEELAWARFVIPLGYLSKVVGGGFKGWQLGSPDPHNNPARFRWEFVPGPTGMKAGDRL